MSESGSTLYLFDSYALIFRAYFAMSKNPLINSKGINVSAISGFTSTLHEILKNQKPDYIACAFDAAAQTDRQAQHEFYKANRQETPEDISMSIPIIKEIINAFGIPILEIEGYEADDLIGTIAKQASQEDIDVYMVTPDKDMQQLVTDKVFVYKPPYMGKPYEILGVEEVCKKWEVENPEQVIDILGLWGDSVDNIPGVKGVGEKTAKKLIGEYGSIENIYEHIDELKGALKTKMENDKELAMISKELATIITDAPIQFDKDSYSISPIDKEKLSALFTELEFRTLGKRILGDEFSVNKKESPSNGQFSLFDSIDTNTEAAPAPEETGKNIENTEHDYQIIQSVEELEDVLKKALKKRTLSIDTETSSLNPHETDLVGISLAIQAQQAWYLAWESEKATDYKKVLNQYLQEDKLLKIGQNIKFDLIVLAYHGIEIKGPFFDTMIAHYLIDPETKHSMDFLAETYLGYTPVSIESLIGKKGVKQGSMKDVPLEKIAPYACEDADITYQLYEILSSELEQHGVKKIFDEIEIPLLPVLLEMELAGVNLDVDFLKAYSEELGNDLSEIRDKIFEKAGKEFNLDSPKQMGEVLFDHLKIPYSGKKTKTGQYSTNEETLQRLAGDQPIVQEILEYRELTKLKSTYVDALPGLVSERTNRLHTTFNQTVTSTGRLSSANPNLQNIPIRTERGRHIRKAFSSRSSDYLIMAADYSQVELRIVASMSEDEKMMQAFRQGKDIHAATAANVYGVALEDVDSTMRRNAKMVNFGIIYGISAFGLSQRLSISRTEAAELINAYFEQYPGIKNYMDNAIASAKEDGFAQTLLGRKRYLRDIRSGNQTVRGFAERNAINAPIQGTAADMIKIAMIEVDKAMKKEGVASKMLLQVHDELLFDLKKSEQDAMIPLVEKAMKEALPLKVPVVVDIGIGENWLEAH